MVLLVVGCSFIYQDLQGYVESGPLCFLPGAAVWWGAQDVRKMLNDYHGHYKH